MKRLPQYCSDSLYWLGYNLSGIAVPVLISVIALIAMELSFSVGAITSGGQFAVYSTAMSTIMIYTIAKPNPKRLPLTEVFGLLCFVTFAMSVTFFVLAVLSTNGADIASWIIEWPTISLFILCVIITFSAVMADSRRAEMSRQELMHIKENTQKQLNEAFDKTEQGGGKQR